MRDVWTFTGCALESPGTTGARGVCLWGFRGVLRPRGHPALLTCGALGVREGRHSSEGRHRHCLCAPRRSDDSGRDKVVDATEAKIKVKN